MSAFLGGLIVGGVCGFVATLLVGWLYPVRTSVRPRAIRSH
jgi:hypothetical protein